MASPEDSSPEDKILASQLGPTGLSAKELNLNFIKNGYDEYIFNKNINTITVDNVITVDAYHEACKSGPEGYSPGEIEKNQLAKTTRDMKKNEKPPDHE